MATLGAYRDYNPHDVINHFASDVIPMNKGTFVKILSGMVSDDVPNNMLGAIGGTFLGTVSQRYGVLPRVTNWTSGSQCLGMTLYDTRETDENGESLKFNPRKAAEMQVVISGQPVPIIDRGTFLISGIAGSPTAGSLAYLENTDTRSVLSTTGTTTVGNFLGPKDSNGFAYVRIKVS